MSDKTNFSEEENVSLLDTIIIFFNWIKAIIINIFKTIGQILSSVLRFLIKHFFLLLIAFITGACLIFMYNKYYKETNSVIEIRLACDSSIFNDIETEVEKLNLLIENKSFYLSSNVNTPIDNTLLQVINNIKIGYCMDKGGDGLVDFVTYKKEEAVNKYHDIVLKGNNQPDKIESKIIQEQLRNTLFLRLKVSTTNSDEIDSIKNAIVSYLNLNKNINKDILIKKDALLNELSVLNNQIILLDSLIKIEYLSSKNKNVVIQRFESNSNNNNIVIGTKLYHNEIFELERKKSDIKSKLYRANEPITISSDFHYPSSKTTTTLICYLFIWMFLFVTICLFLDYNKTIIRYIKKNR